MRLRPAPVLLALIALSGCSTQGIDTTYGRMRSSTINGTGLFAESLRSRGHEIRTFSRLGTRLEEWADAIVRFSPRPGPPDKKEAEWYDRWLNASPGRIVVYIPHDFDAIHEYWTRLESELPRDANPRLLERVIEAKDKSTNWGARIGSFTTSSTDSWFQVEAASGSNLESKKLEGPWAKGLDGSKVGLPNRSTLKLDNERALLLADGKPVAMDWKLHNESRVLVAANGAYLLNEPMTNPSRTPLASRVVEWISRRDVDNLDDPDSDAETYRRVAFVEGHFVAVDRPKTNESGDYRLEIQLGLLGLAACLAAAPRLGRARPEPPSGADRPVAHPEALGALLARTGKASEARGILETYRRWRLRPGSTGRPKTDDSRPDPAPRTTTHANPHEIG